MYQAWSAAAGDNIPAQQSQNHTSVQHNIATTPHFHAVMTVVSRKTECPRRTVAHARQTPRNKIRCQTGLNSHFLCKNDKPKGFRQFSEWKRARRVRLNGALRLVLRQIQFLRPKVWLAAATHAENKGVTRIRSLELRRPPNVLFGPVSPQFNPFPRPMMYLENAMKFVWISAALAAFASLNSAQAGLFHHNSCNSCNSAPSCAAPASVCSAAPSCAAPAAACAPACAPTCAAPVSTCAPVYAAPVSNCGPSCAPAASCCNSCAPRCHFRCPKICMPKLCMPKFRLCKSRCGGSNCGSNYGSNCGSNCAPSCAAPAAACGPTCAAPATSCCN
jgi:hypothetical protein